MTKLDWTPPEGMSTSVAIGWRKFYADAQARYGITPDDYAFLYRIQRGRCCICRKAKGKNPMDPRGTGQRRLGIDHNHVTGQVRGLLCTGGDKTCNRIIGWLSPASLQRAVDYVTGVRMPGRWLSASMEFNDAAREDLAMRALWGDDA